jgi:SAP domain-containing new25
MPNKPSVISSPDDVQNYYWMKTDLIAFCKQHGLQTQGAKFDLMERIKTYLSTGHRIAYQAIKKPTEKDSSKSITENTLVKNYSNDAETRSFFVENIGKKFKFNAYLRQFTNPGNILPNMTYGDLIEGWISFEAEKNSNKNHAIPLQFEYNRFIKDFFAHEKDSTLEMAISAWKTLSSKKGQRTYEQFKKHNKLD